MVGWDHWRYLTVLLWCYQKLLPPVFLFEETNGHWRLFIIHFFYSGCETMLQYSFMLEPTLS